MPQGALSFSAATQFDCQTPDEQQRALTERWLTPEIDGIAADLLLIRAKVDAHFARLNSVDQPAQEVHLASLTDIQNYPYGYCERIRNWVWDSIQKQLQQPSRATPHLQVLREFCAGGGLMRRIWGELTHGPYLQNAIQLGAYYVDAANDTVDINKPKLEIKFLWDTTFRNIDNFEQYFDIVTHYYHWDTYPNLYFPRLAPLFPGIAIHAQAGMLVLCDIPLPVMLKNLHSNGQLARRFLYESDFARKTLPPAQHAIVREFRKHLRLKPANPAGTDAALPSSVAESVANMENWLRSGVPQKEAEQVAIALDDTRKRLDRALRRYSLPPGIQVR